MDKELEFTLPYWRDRANFFEQILGDIKALKVELQDEHIERLEGENAELKKVLVKLTEAIIAQLKHRNDDVIPKDSEASMHAKSYRSQRIRINTIEMSARSANALRHQGVKTLGDLCRYTEFDLLVIPNFGRGSLKEIKEILASHNLSLKPTLRRS